MRPRSVTGPLILVTLGVVFLLNNIWHDIPFWRIFADYWPAVLILIGVAGLVEVFYHVSRGETLPPRPFTGGGLIWLLVLIMFAVWGGARNGIQIGRLSAGGVTILGSDYTYNVNANDPGTGVRRVVFDNVRGNISLRGEEAPGIRVTGRKTIRAFSPTDASKADQQSPVRMERQGDLLIVHADEPSSMRMLSISTDLDIALSRGLDVEIRGRSGDVTVDTIDGSVDVSNSRGDVRLSNIGKDVKVDAARSNGLVRASAVKGNVDLEGRGGDLQLENIQGQVTISGEFGGTLEFQAIAKPLHFQSSRSDLRVAQIPGQVTIDGDGAKLDNLIGPVRYETHDRDVHATNITESLEVKVDRGDVQVTQEKMPLPKMDISVRRSGEVTLSLPEKAPFSMDGRAMRGEVHNDFGDLLQNESNGHEATLKGRIGNGPAITVTTERGNLTLRKN